MFTAHGALGKPARGTGQTLFSKIDGLLMTFIEKKSTVPPGPLRSSSTSEPDHVPGQRPFSTTTSPVGQPAATLTPAKAHRPIRMHAQEEISAAFRKERASSAFRHRPILRRACVEAGREARTRPRTTKGLYTTGRTPCGVEPDRTMPSRSPIGARMRWPEPAHTEQSLAPTGARRREVPCGSALHSRRRWPSFLYLSFLLRCSVVPRPPRPETAGTSPAPGAR